MVSLSQPLRILSLVISMTMFWMALNTTLALPDFLMGVLLSTLCVLITGRSLHNNHLGQLFSIIRHPIRFIFLIYIFFYELFISAFMISFMIMKPKRSWRFSPGILAVPLDVKSNFGITAFANLITMIPGTLAIDISDDHKILYMHVLDTSDPLDVQTKNIYLGNQRNSVKRDFEKNIVKIFSEK